MKRTILEKLILVIAWTGLVCGILAGFGVGKGDYIITFDGGEAVVRSTYVMDEDKCVDMFKYC